jgi:hypothetical protein
MTQQAAPGVYRFACVMALRGLRVIKPVDVQHWRTHMKVARMPQVATSSAIRAIAGIVLSLGVASTLAQQLPPSAPLLKPLPAAPRPLTPMPAPAQPKSAAVVPPGNGAAVRAPWPARFALTAASRDSFGFAVGQPGVVVVTVNAQGAPVSVVLRKPDGAQVERVGGGRIVLDYNASAQDVARGLLWMVYIAPASGSDKSAANAGVARTAVISSGTVEVKHPLADERRVQAELGPALASVQQRLASPPTFPDIGTSRSAKLEAEVVQQQTRRQNAMLEGLRGRLSAEASRAMAQHIERRAAARTSDVALATAVGGRAQASLAVAPPSGAVGTGQIRSANTSVAPVSAGGTAAEVATPSIASLSVNAGQPGDPVLIAGGGFGATAGEVRFIVGQGKELVAPMMSWSDTQIFVAVPEASGLQAFAGQLYVRRAGGQSRLVPFQFNPSIEVREIRPFPDRRECLIRGGELGSHWGGHVRHDFGSALFGTKDYDEFFQARQLRNGWTVREVVLQPHEVFATTLFGARGGVDVAEWRPGSSSPYVKLHWWVDGLSVLRYRTPAVVIAGPRGVPHE